MTILLRRSDDLANVGEFDSWLSITGTVVNLDSFLKLPGLAERLESSFEGSRNQWWELGRKMADDPSARTAHAPTGGVYGSDFGLMLAWVSIARDLAQDSRIHLVVCDDPWVFRQIADISEVEAGQAPSLFKSSSRLFIRGYMARVAVAARSIKAYLTLRRYRAVFSGGEPTLLVYGHPASNGTDRDAYFGNLMAEIPQTRRLLHVDCPAVRAEELSSGGRTASLHAWGSLWDAISLFFELWSPRSELTQGAFGWLIRRAAAHENGGGGPAMVRWQINCQRRWLKSVRPIRVVWPWENFAWERAFCLEARSIGIATAGYQHTAIGPHQLNYSTATNPDGDESLPDTIIANGPVYAQEMIEWKVPEEKIVIGGSFRIRPEFRGRFDPSGPIFVPLSGQLAAARQQLQAAKMLAEAGRQVRVKEHPMYPLAFSETDNFKRTQEGIGGAEAYSGVLFTTGTSGLEAVLAGLPAFRLLLDDELSINILPSNLEVPSVTINQVVEILAATSNPPVIDWGEIFSMPNLELWQKLLSSELSNA
jgi:hypothetical protein